MKKPTQSQRIEKLEQEIVRLQGLIDSLQTVKPPYEQPPTIPYYPPYPPFNPWNPSPVHYYQYPIITCCQSGERK